ncbi:MAG: isocitrate lyase [Ardenticatenaceae bacterium]|nr:isocitrate lyase [Anaerolineales bacterium]MCB8922467.1 isocitrate lyase [Ardenticatenaceae bacterium]MCB8989936.1 isocitrate lyase [Ardenticatenaceae bacterium]
MIDKKEVQALENSWRNDSRWSGIKRPYSAEDVLRLRGSIKIEYTLARMGAERLWKLLKEEPYVHALGALSGNQAVQMVQAGLKAIYLSGWQVAADANVAAQTYPDQSLYPANSAPMLAQRINNALRRADQINHLDDANSTYWMAPIVADAESGFGGNLNAYELMLAMIEAGASGVHFEDQLSSAKKCGHMGGKVLVPTREAVQKLISARLAADVAGVPTLVIARTDANAADLITSDIDENDKPFLTGERTVEGFHRTKAGITQAISRGLAYAPYADVVWCETAHPDIEEARQFAEAIHAEFPGKMLAYNCSPSFNWKLNLDETTIATFQRELGKMGYAFQFVTLAGFHSLNASMFQLASDYRSRGMAAYADFQEKEFDLHTDYGFKAIKHQSFVGAGYYDEIQTVVSQGEVSTAALKGSTEEEQFEADLIEEVTHAHAHV